MAGGVRGALPVAREPAPSRWRQPPMPTDAAQAQVASLQAENQSMAADGQRVMSAYEQENQQLRAALAAAKSGPIPAAAGPQAMYGGVGSGELSSDECSVHTCGTGRAGGGERTTGTGGGGARQPDQARGVREGGAAGTATRISGGSTSYTDSEKYLPPQLDRDRARDRRCRRGRRCQLSDRSAAGRSADYRPGALGLQPRQAAHDGGSRVASSTARRAATSLRRRSTSSCSA